jgi:hypothetical protein
MQSGGGIVDTDNQQAVDGENQRARWPTYMRSTGLIGHPGQAFRRSLDQWISGGRRSHGGAEARRKQREESTTRHKGNWRVP